MNKHKEKRKNDVKENEKTCGQHAQNLGTEAKNRLFGRAKSGVGKNGHPSILDSGASFTNKAKTEITTLFEQLLLPKLPPCRFILTFIYTQREKMV